FDREILLLDEPFGALDALTRMSMQELLLQIFEEIERTIVFITHDVEEAIYLSDVVYVLTARPTQVKLRMPVPLSRPRKPSMLTDETCMELRRRLLSIVREEAGMR